MATSLYAWGTPRAGAFLPEWVVPGLVRTARPHSLGVKQEVQRQLPADGKRGAHAPERGWWRALEVARREGPGAGGNADAGLPGFGPRCPGSHQNLEGWAAGSDGEVGGQGWRSAPQPGSVQEPRECWNSFVG